MDHGLGNRNEEERTVNSIIKKYTDSSKWKTDDLPFHLTPEILLEIHAHPFAHSTNPTPDKEIWKLTNNGNFTTKSAYHFIYSLSNKNLSRQTQEENTNLYWICRTPGHPREVFFL